MQINEITGAQHRDVNADIDEDKLVAWIEKRCAPILKHYRVADAPLFRGIRDVESDISLQKVHKERTAMTMGKPEIDAWHKSFQLVGLDATRRNSIFTSPHHYIGGGFGTLYAVFPIGDFTYTWFEKQTSDFPLFQIKAAYHKLTDRGTADAANDGTFDYKAMASVLTELGPRTDNLHTAIAQEKEVIIRCQSYLAIDAYSKGDLIDRIIDPSKANQTVAPEDLRGTPSFDEE